MTATQTVQSSVTLPPPIFLAERDDSTEELTIWAETDERPPGEEIKRILENLQQQPIHKHTPGQGWHYVPSEPRLLKTEFGWIAELESSEGAIWAEVEELCKLFEFDYKDLFLKAYPGTEPGTEPTVDQEDRKMLVKRSLFSDAAITPYDVDEVLKDIEAINDGGFLNVLKAAIEAMTPKEKLVRQLWWRNEYKFQELFARPQDVEKDADMLLEWIAKLDALPGIRYGDFIKYPSGEFRRVAHHWGHSIQPDNSKFGSSFNIGSSGLSFSGGLDQSIPIDQFHRIEGETREGLVWMFHGNNPGGGRGIKASLPFRVYEYKPTRKSADSTQPTS